MYEDKNLKQLEKSLQKRFTFPYSTNRIDMNEIKSDFKKSLCFVGIIIFLPIWTIHWGLDNLFFWFHCLRNDIPFKFFSFTSFNPGIPFHKIDIIENKIKIEISSLEHPPPHFHVYIDNKKYSFDIKNCHQINGRKLKSRELRKIESWHFENKKLVIKTWDETRPTNCPVGPYKNE